MFQEGVEAFQGGLSSKNYMSITQTSQPTVTRDLRDLVEKGVFKKSGELRYTRYSLNILFSVVENTSNLRVSDSEIRGGGFQPPSPR
jgi:DeoR/GlpR family transcriptional regulator of sugar metabolism